MTDKTPQWTWQFRLAQYRTYTHSLSVSLWTAVTHNVVRLSRFQLHCASYFVCFLMILQAEFEGVFVCLNLVLLPSSCPVQVEFILQGQLKGLKWKKVKTKTCYLNKLYMFYVWKHWCAIYLSLTNIKGPTACIIYNVLTPMCVPSLSVNSPEIAQLFREFVP